jgi:hypothetical protein
MCPGGRRATHEGHYEAARERSPRLKESACQRELVPRLAIRAQASQTDCSRSTERVGQDMPSTDMDRRWVAFLVASSLSAACASLDGLSGGGSDHDAGDAAIPIEAHDGASDAGSGVDGGDAGRGPPPGDGSLGAAVCPPTPPTAGVMCTKSSTACEYGSNSNPSCNQTASCPNGVWEYMPPASCPTGSCPAHFPGDGGILGSLACHPSDLVCAYAGEGTCGCGNPAGGLSEAGTVWVCSAIEPGCPTPRPDQGTPCVASPFGNCSYAPCQGGIELACTGGAWTKVPVACVPPG